ncbi:MAG: ribonuclease HII [Holosporales bacterium]|nr:ribonuclease HII [Holosporales bacterium]
MNHFYPKKIMPSFEIENQYENKIVCGTDEAGLGPLAGPIVVCSCVFLDYNLPTELLININDSKKLTKKKREFLFDKIINYENLIYKISIIDAEIIDSIGLSNAWKKGIISSVQNLDVNPDVCIIDGIRQVHIKDKIICPIVKGDQKSYTIATASIIAKVTRDRIMQKIHTEFPEYGFEKNVGYGTKFHIDMLKKIGACKYHRKSYSPVFNVISIG